MGDKTEQPGPSEQSKKTFVIEPLEGDDVEGHRRAGTHLTGDEPGPSEARHKVSFTESDEDDVEGHRIKSL